MAAERREMLTLQVTANQGAALCKRRRGAVTNRPSLAPLEFDMEAQPSRGSLDLPLSRHSAKMNLDDLQFFNPYGNIRQTENRLPHWQQQGAVYFLTFHLGDALPASLLAQWHAEREAWLRHHPQPWTAKVEREYHDRLSAATERWLDAGHGSCLLRRPQCARLVGDALAFFEGQRCLQITWVVMPNHVHAVFVLHVEWKLEQLIHSWKRCSAREINKLVGRQGGLWQCD
jgi:hypothetical protein